MSEPSSDRNARRLLAIGMAAGIAAAGYGIVRSGGTSAVDADDAIAVVNGQTISRDGFARFVAAVAAERRSVDLDLDGKRRLLDRMIDEELLLQRGAFLELYRHEPTARRSMVSALIASVTGEAETGEPDTPTLQRFYDENRDRFKRLGRVELDVVRVSVGDRPEALGFREAEEIVRRARDGADFGVLREERGDPPVFDLPGGPLPLETVRQYLGPTAARVASELGVGEVSDPVRGADGYWVMRIVDRTPGEFAPFDEVAAQVRGEYLRSRGEEALGDYLTSLRDGAEVRILDPILAEP